MGEEEADTYINHFSGAWQAQREEGLLPYKKNRPTPQNVRRIQDHSQENAKTHNRSHSELGSKINAD